MTINTSLRSFAALLTFAALQGPLTAQDAASKSKSAAPNPYAFSIRSYRLPGNDLISGFVSKDRGQLHAPPLPPPSASHGELEAFLKRNHAVVKEFLAQHGITLPDGSLACYDPASETLVLRAMQIVHDIVEPWAETVLNQNSKHLAWTLNILEAPPPAVRAAMAGAAGNSDHTAAFDKLLPQSKIKVTMRGETKGGQRTVSNQGPFLDEINDYSTDDKQRVQFSLASRDVGTQLELDPVISADGRLLDINIALHHPYAAPIKRWGQVSTGSAPKVEAQWLDYPRVTTQNNIAMLSGATRLLGVWSPEGSPEPAQTTMQAAFLRMVIVHLLPLADPRAEKILVERGESVIPTPKAVRPVADPSLPPGMSVRRFRIPPDFLSSSGSGSASAAPADPFASGGAPVNEPRFTRSITVEDILRSQGVPFPEGASANYISQSSELVVRNTPANIELVAVYVESLNRQSPKLLGFTLHIVQADAALIRRLERETLGLPDHGAALKTLEDAAAQGTAKIVGSLWIETKGGQRATSEYGIEYSSTTEVNLAGGHSIPAEPATATPATSPTSAKITPQAHRLSIAQEVSHVGLGLEIDPVVGADGDTIDLNVALSYDYAPPVRHLASDPAPDQTQRIAAPLTEFRETKFQTATTMLSGSTRLLSIWKPSGTPELEGDILQAAFLRADIVTVEPAASGK